MFARHLAQCRLGQGADHGRGGHLLFELLEPLDRGPDGLEVGQHPAQPAVVDIEHAAAFGLFPDDVLGLFLGAHEQQRAAGAGKVAHKVVGAAKHAHGLLQIDDMNPVTSPEDIRLHLGVPAAGLVPEVDASLQKLFHADFGHGIFSLLGCLLALPEPDAAAKLARATRVQLFIDSRNSSLVLLPCILSSRNSIASTALSCDNSLRRIQTRLSVLRGSNNSSLRVVERWISMVGKMRFSNKRRSSATCWLPVPLNSSKITSSMRLPVSTNAVAMIVRLPPSSVLRAAPKNFLGLCKALESTPPDRILPEGGTTVL